MTGKKSGEKWLERRFSGSKISFMKILIRSKTRAIPERL